MPKKTNSDTEKKKIKTTKKTKMKAPSKCDMDAIIRNHTYAAIGIGFIPIPLVDLAGLMALQLKMISSITKAHGVEFKKERVKSIISALCGGALTVASVPVLASLFKAIPVVGQTVGAATLSISGAASTYALGYVFDKHFKEGGTLLNISVDNMKEGFTDYYQKGETAIKARFSKTKDTKDTEAEADKTPA